MAATAEERQMNLAALQQRDPYIYSIRDSASQVAVYTFNANLNEWVRHAPAVFHLSIRARVKCELRNCKWVFCELKCEPARDLRSFSRRLG